MADIPLLVPCGLLLDPASWKIAGRRSRWPSSQNGQAGQRAAAAAGASAAIAVVAAAAAAAVAAAVAIAAESAVDRMLADTLLPLPQLPPQRQQFQQRRWRHNQLQHQQASCQPWLRPTSYLGQAAWQHWLRRRQKVSSNRLGIERSQQG